MLEPILFLWSRQASLIQPSYSGFAPCRWDFLYGKADAYIIVYFVWLALMVVAAFVMEIIVKPYERPYEVVASEIGTGDIEKAKGAASMPPPVGN